MWLRKREKDDSPQQALEAATESLEKIKERRPEVEHVSRTVRLLRERNHFAEQLQHIMEGPR